ncbi:MAG TPA: ATP-binding cassette domain-containing protein, partial [Terriglobales bacterium]|nr:ATP-binding cassette domain-containing protein [Terriglobales bacterium]
MIACVQQLSVRFGHTDALADVSLSFAAGEIHTLVGENGAGKSTLLRVLAGMVIPTGGSVELPRSTRPDAAVEWVPQETALPADLTAAEWIFLGRELRNPLGLLRVAEMERAAGDALAEIDAAIASRRRLRDMSAAQRKQVQLARALRLRPRLLLVDEPTAVLATAEAGHVFAALRRLRDRGAAIVYVSHHLAEVLALADRVTVLRDGQVISTDPVHAVDQAQLVQRMVGRPLRPAGRFHRRGGGEVLRTELGWSALRDALRAPQHERDAEEPQSVRPEEARSAVSKAQVTPRFEARSEPHRRTPLRGFSARAVGWHERYRRGAD